MSSNLAKEQIRHKLTSFEGKAKSSKARSVMKWWSKCISISIAKTACRNVAFKVARMRKSIMEGQDELTMRKLSSDEVGLEDDNSAVSDDLGYNSDMYIANQEVVYD